MSTIRQFESVCDDIEKKGSRKEKEVLFKEVCESPVIKECFRLACDPFIQFYRYFPEETGLFTGSDPKFWEYILTLRARKPIVAPGLLGKWVTRLLNKNLKVGIGRKTAEGILGEFKPTWATWEKCRVSRSEWLDLLFHLLEARSWLVQYIKIGVRATIQVHQGKLFPIAEVPIYCTGELQIPPSFEGKALDGRFFIPGKTQRDVYGALQDHKNPHPELLFQVLDILDGNTFSVRQQELKSKLGSDLYYQEPELIDLETLNQSLEAEKNEANILLRWPGAYYGQRGEFSDYFLQVNSSRGDS